MCEANVYVIQKDGTEKLLMESVDKVTPTEEGFILENIYSQRREIRARLKEMALVEHRILLEEK